MQKPKCKHPGIGRRILTKFSFISKNSSKLLLNFGLFIQKIANIIMFEHFWKLHVQNEKSVQILTSFTKTNSKKPIWDIALKMIKKLRKNGKILEFGTNNGGSLHYFQKNLSDAFTLYGFDSFEGIPEKWDSLPKGSMKGHGFPSELWGNQKKIKKKISLEVKRTGIIPPPPQKNIVIDKGLFAHSVPRFLKNGVPNDIRLIHFDADIYMGTRPVLDSICGQLDYKYLILFDEFYSVNHEFKAWIEFIEYFEVKKWRIIAISEDGVQTLIEVN